MGVVYYANYLVWFEVARADLLRSLGWSYREMEAEGIILPVMSSHLLAIFAAALGVGGTFMVITLAALQEAKRVAGRDATTLIAAMTSAFAAGQIIGPLTVASDGNGFAPGLIAAAVLLVVSALALNKDH